MVKLGQYNTLKSIEREPQGVYLEGNDYYGDILLPNKFVPEGLEMGDEVEVFIHLDSDDYIIATTRKPLAVVGEFASLKVKSVVEKIGAFVDWGLDKDLLVPFREQLFEMQEGNSYVVYLYVDSSDRIAATTRLNKHFSKDTPEFTKGEMVQIIPYQKTDMGVKAVINGKFTGMIFKEDIHTDLKLGQDLTAYIKQVRPDQKIDLYLQAQGIGGRDELTQLILDKLNEEGGCIDVNAKSSSEIVKSTFGVSRNKFKIALGHLYKQKLILITETGISLKKSPKAD